MKNNILKIAALFLISPFAANAAPISYEFSGSLSSVKDLGNLLGGDFSIGDIFSGSFSYEPNSPDGSPSDTYFTSPAEVSITTVINGYVFTSKWESVDLNSDADGIYFISAYDSDPFIDLGSNSGRLMTLYFFDDTGSLYDDDVLPLSLDLNDFSGTLFQLFGDTGPGGPYFGMTGSISSLARVSVPEPGTLTLLGLGLAGMGFTRRRRRL